MDNDEFNELKEFYLNKPDSMVSGYDKSDKARMSSFYRKVREINWRLSCDASRESYDDNFGK